MRQRRPPLNSERAPLPTERAPAERPARKADIEPSPASIRDRPRHPPARDEENSTGSRPFPPVKAKPEASIAVLTVGDLMKTRLLIMTPEQPNETPHLRTAGSSRPTANCRSGGAGARRQRLRARHRPGRLRRRPQFQARRHVRRRDGPPEGPAAQRGRDRDLSPQRAPPPGRQRSGSARLDRRPGGAVRARSSGREGGAQCER